MTEKVYAVIKINYDRHDADVLGVYKTYKSAKKCLLEYDDNYKPDEKYCEKCKKTIIINSDDNGWSCDNCNIFYCDKCHDILETEYYDGTKSYKQYNRHYTHPSNCCGVDSVKYIDNKNSDKCCKICKKMLTDSKIWMCNKCNKCHCDNCDDDLINDYQDNKPDIDICSICNKGDIQIFVYVYEHEDVIKDDYGGLVKIEEVTLDE